MMLTIRYFYPKKKRTLTPLAFEKYNKATVHRDADEKARMIHKSRLRFNRTFNSTINNRTKKVNLGQSPLAIILKHSNSSIFNIKNKQIHGKLELTKNLRKSTRYDNPSLLERPWNPKKTVKRALAMTKALVTGALSVIKETTKHLGHAIQRESREKQREKGMKRNKDEG